MDNLACKELQVAVARASGSICVMKTGGYACFGEWASLHKQHMCACLLGTRKETTYTK